MMAEESTEGTCAAIRLQALSRGQNSRLKTSRTRAFKKEREHAAIKLQGQQRRLQATQRMQEHSAMMHASTSIERVYRGHSHRRKMTRRASEGRAIDQEDISDGLHTLGLSSLNLRHVYLGLRVPEATINDLALLALYPHLQMVELPHNKITDIRPLQHLPHLTALDLSDNLLTQVLDVTFPKCDAGSKGAAHLGSQLRRVDLSRNAIASIRDLSRHAFLEELLLDGNCIAKITGLDNCQYLRLLSLNSNRIGRIDGLHGLAELQELRLNNNQLSFLDNFDTLVLLRRLSLAHNRLESLDGLQRCKHLCSLNVAHNMIKYVREVEFLAHLELLTELDLTGNHCTSLEFYRQRVVLRLQRLSRLDDEEVTSKQKVKAINLHAAEGSDLEHRIQTHKKIFGDTEPWVDYLPPFVEPETAPMEPERLIGRFVNRLIRCILMDAAAAATN